MTEEQAKEVYEILVIHCGANAYKESEFLRYVTDPSNAEFRFGGLLGFGGKFYHTAHEWRVSCYKENETPERVRMIKTANRELILLKACMDNPLNSIARCLHERYQKKYPIRYVEIEPEEKREGSRLCIVFRHANNPHRPYCRILLESAISVETPTLVGVLYAAVKAGAPNFRSWDSSGRVPYEDPEMEEKLDLLVAKVVETTPRFEEEYA